MTLSAAMTVGAPARAEEPAPVVLCDFDKGEPADGWTFRELRVTEIATPHGRGLKLAADPQTPFGSMSRTVDVHDWRAFRAFSMRVRVETSDAIELRLMLDDSRRGARLVRRFTIEPGDWRDVVVPLKDFRGDGKDQAGTFAQLDRLVIQWIGLVDVIKDAVTIDDLALLPGDRGVLSCCMTPEDVQRLAFPDAKSRRLESEHFLLVDDVPALVDADAKKLLAHLEEGLALMGERYGVTGGLGDKVPFVLFATRDEYTAFVPRLGERFGATVTPPKADGFSILGMGMGWFDPKQGWDRPVFVHEGLHGAIHRLLAVGSNGNLVQEGLAAAVQARLHPGSLDRKELAESFAKRGDWLVPWADCFAEPRVPLNRYPQLLSIMDLLAEKHRDALPKVWDAVRALREPLHKSAPEAIAKALGTDAAKLEEEWWGWGAAYYGGK